MRAKNDGRNMTTQIIQLAEVAAIKHFEENGFANFHFNQFGLLTDPATSQPDRSRGWRYTVMSHGHPKGCFPVLSPCRISENINAIPFHIDNQNIPAGALIGTPVYTSTDDGIAGAWMAITRITHSTTIENGASPGENVTSSAILLEWEQFAEFCGDLGSLRPEVDLRQVNNRTSDKAHMNARPFILKTQNTASRSLLSDAILGAIIEGTTLHLDRRHAQSEDTFLEALSYALMEVSASCRAHVSFSSGWSWPDDDVQIAWSPDLGRMKTPVDTISALAEIGAALARHKELRETNISLEVINGYQSYVNWIFPTWRNNGGHQKIRQVVADHLKGQFQGPDRPLHVVSYDQNKRDKLSASRSRFLSHEIHDFPDTSFSSANWPQHETSSEWNSLFLEWLSQFVCLNAKQIQHLVHNDASRLAISEALEADSHEIHYLVQRSLNLLIQVIGPEAPDVQWTCGAFYPDGWLPSNAHSYDSACSASFDGLLKYLVERPNCMSESTIREITQFLCKQGNSQDATRVLTQMTRNLNQDTPADTIPAVLNATAAIVSALKTHHYQDERVEQPTVIRLHSRRS
ncbi:MAG: hypothetical protein AAF423_01275 [Pseudomonadota bacterium]